MIIEFRKPVVVHNGLLDLLHIYEKFINDLPPNLSRFCENMRSLFAGGIFDTKRIAEEGRLTVFHLSDQSRGATSLDTLRYHLLTRKNSRLKFTVNNSLLAVKEEGMPGYRLDIRETAHIQLSQLYSNKMLKGLCEKRKGEAAQVTANKQNQPSAGERGRVRVDTSSSEHNTLFEETTPKPKDCTIVQEAIHPIDHQQRTVAQVPCEQQELDKSHEAGFDAMMTVQVFLLELESLRASGEKANSDGSSQKNGLTISNYSGGDEQASSAVM